MKESIDDWFDKLPGSDIDLDAPLYSMNDFLRVMEAMQPKWILVEDRLPQDEEYVLVYEKKGNSDLGGILIGWYQPSIDDWWVYYETGEFRHSQNANLMIITHWMPLPNPPTNKTEDNG